MQTKFYHILKIAKLYSKLLGQIKKKAENMLWKHWIFFYYYFFFV